MSSPALYSAEFSNSGIEATAKKVHPLYFPVFNPQPSNPKALAKELTPAPNVLATPKAFIYLLPARVLFL
jgi:hypothetical protein